MTLSKYDEIMEKIAVTPEMKDRILSGLEESDRNTKRKAVPFYKYFSAAACFTVLLIGAVILGWAITGKQEEPSDFMVANEMVEVNTVDELGDAVGFRVEDIAALPFEVKETAYTVYPGELAEIAYIGDSENLYYRKSPGKEDNSGDYNSYLMEAEIIIRDVPVTIKGNNDKYYLAVWTNGEYFYSIQLPDGVTKEKLVSLVEEIEW